MKQVQKKLVGSQQAQRLAEVRHVYAERTIGKAVTRDTISLADGGCIQRPHLSVLTAAMEPFLRQNEYNYNIYPEKNYLTDFLDEISIFFEQECGIKQDGMTCLFAYGVSHVYELFLSVVCSPGDVILSPTGYYHAFADYPSKWGGIFSCIDTADTASCKISSSDLERYKNTKPDMFSKAKAIVLTSPTSSGALYTETEIQEIAEFLQKHELYLFVDEIFREANFSDELMISFGACDAIRHKVITAHSGSKSHSAADFRIGWACGPAELVEKMIYNLEQSVTEISLGLQRIGQAILKTPKRYVQREVAEYKRRVDTVVETIRTINLRLNSTFGTVHIPYIEVPIVPKAGHYFLVRLDAVKGMYFPDGRRIESSIELLEYFLNYQDKAGQFHSVCLSPGYSKGHDDFSFYLAFSQIGYTVYTDQVAALERQYLIDYMTQGSVSYDSFEAETDQAFVDAGATGRAVIQTALLRLEMALTSLKKDESHA